MGRRPDDAAHGVPGPPRAEVDWKQVDPLCGPVEKKAVWPRVQLQNPRDLQMKAWRLHKRAVVKGTNCDTLWPLELGMHYATSFFLSRLLKAAAEYKYKPSWVAEKAQDLFEIPIILSARHLIIWITSP